MFNVRVYGLLINENQQILVSDEYIRGKYYTKFPGGGLEIGEGTRDCLKREFMEEMKLRIEVRDHFYTTDFYQESMFGNGEQILSIYYYVKPLESLPFVINKEKFDFTEEQLTIYEEKKAIETFRFINLSDFSEKDVTLPIDKVVADMLANGNVLSNPLSAVSYEKSDFRRE